MVLWLLRACQRIQYLTNAGTRRGYAKKITAEALIKGLDLEALPVEGGHFRQTYKDSRIVSVTMSDLAGPLQKPRSTALLYLLSDDPDRAELIGLLTR